jgi:SAM-dependent methyltransferase
VIGEYARPRTRLPGAGGAPEIATHAKQTFVVLKHSSRSFVPKLDFVTSAGYFAGHGSRARSGVTRRGLFRGMDYLGVDILAGDNVDVVGDAHELSDLVAGRRFDGVYSVSTFEHVLMPWKVALEINRVLRTGGVCFIHTHQALGMHDMPWDYWRFSDTAWHALFNRRTGFEILATRLAEPMLLVPATYTDHWRGYEGSQGFATSAVTVRKVAETDLGWDVSARDVAVGEYPE